MADIADTQPIEISPQCCPKAREYIRLAKSNMMDGPDKDGYALSLAKSLDVVFKENVSWCPWCGKPIH